MIKARALFYALVVSFLIALISGLLISLSHLQRLQQIDQNQHARLNRNVKSGLNLLLGSAQAEIPLHFMDLYGDGQDTVALMKKDWGMFSVATVMAYAQTIGGGDSLGRSMLIGEKATPLSYPALYLADRNSPLSLAGQTVIKGTAYLPAAGVRRSQIGALPYIGTQLLYGEQLRSGTALPPMNKAAVQSIKAGLATVQGIGSPLPDSLHQSFSQQTVLISGQNIQLTSQQLSGNIVVRASGEITVHHNCQLEDVLLFAPKIRFKQGFKGTVQAFASDTLVVEEGCTFPYPSVLGLLQYERSAPSVLLNINNNCHIEGLVFATQTIYSLQKPKLFIGENTKITGMVWTDGLLELRGMVQGSVQCESFQLAVQGGIYQNHLYNATIDQAALPKGYVGPFAGERKATKAIAKWIK